MVARGLSDWMMNDLLVLGAGAGLLADVAISHYAGGPSEREAIITTSLSYDDYFFMHQSDIYYINDPDAGHYVEMTEGAELKKEQTKAAMEREREGAPKKALSKKYITEPSEIEEQSKTVVTPSSPQSSEEVVETPEAKNPAAQRRTFNVVD